tara:strand:- start:7338 stop:8195 length:858 start_codon:yes stop_codon:yes gene_type:complete
MNFDLKEITVLIFTDIDGTFINNDTFNEGGNIEIAEMLNNHRHILIYNSSKTFHEIISMQNRFKTSFPFICETGGGIYYKNIFDNDSVRSREGYSIMYESMKIDKFEEIIKKEIRNNFKNDVDLFDDLCIDDRSRLSGLSGTDLDLASKRDFSILVRWKSDESRYTQFESVLENYGLNIIKGGRFCHICSSQDKGKSVMYFLDQIKSSRKYDRIITVGIGDSTNDIEMLNNVDYACVVKSKNNSNLLKKIDSNNIVSSINHAPEGWAECIHNVFSKIKSQEHLYG